GLVARWCAQRGGARRARAAVAAGLREGAGPDVFLLPGCRPFAQRRGCQEGAFHMGRHSNRARPAMEGGVPALSAGGDGRCSVYTRWLEVRPIMTTYALLQKWPPEALDSDEGHYGVTEVLAVGTRDETETFLADYRRRHEAACQEWRVWEADGREWDSTFDHKHAELCEHHAVSALIDDVEFEIVPVGISPGGTV